MTARDDTGPANSAQHNRTSRFPSLSKSFSLQTFTMSIPARKIGGALVPEIGFGAMGISAFYGTPESDEDRFKVGTRLEEGSEPASLMDCRF